MYLPESAPPWASKHGFPLSHSLTSSGKTPLERDVNLWSIKFSIT